jgi:hypothetical protein
MPKEETYSHFCLIRTNSLSLSTHSYLVVERKKSPIDNKLHSKRVLSLPQLTIFYFMLKRLYDLSTNITIFSRQERWEKKFLAYWHFLRAKKKAGNSSDSVSVWLAYSSFKPKTTSFNMCIMCILFEQSGLSRVVVVPRI